MKNLIILVVLFSLLACNEKTKRAKSSKISSSDINHAQMEHDSIISKRFKPNVYTESILILEDGLIQLANSKKLQNKIKIDLSGLYLLDYNMDSYGHADSSFAKSITIFEEVLAYDKESQFLSKTLGMEQEKVDSIHVLWDKASSKKDTVQVIFDVTEELFQKLY